MRLNLTTALPLAFVLVSGCWRRTEIAAVWHEPGSGLLNFNRAVAVFATTDEAMRRAVEDELAMKFPNSVPSYRLVPSAPTSTRTRFFRRCAPPGSTERSSCASRT